MYIRWSEFLAVLSNIYKNFILFILIFGFCSLAMPVFAVEEMTEQQIMEEDLDDEAKTGDYYVSDIEILGANIIKPEYILKKIKLQKGDLYDKELMQQDLKTIYKMGYFTERMKAIPIKNSDGNISLKIVLEENVPITDFSIEGNTVIATEELMQYLLPLKGKPQNIADINAAIEKINACYFSKGYILSKIDSVYDDPDGMLNLFVTEGKIDKILISGNEKTKEYVIERNIMTEPGSVYNENIVKQDLVRLYSTQAFKDVNRTIEISDNDPEKYNLTIELKEQRTASVSVGGGLDSATGAFGSVGISDNNFRGRNQRISLSGMVGSGILMSDASIKDHMNYQAELSFFEPQFLNSDNSLMSKIYYRDLGSYQIPLAMERRVGVEATLAHRLKFNPKLSTTLTTGIEHIHLEEGGYNSIKNLYEKNGFNIADRAKELEGGLFFKVAPGFAYDSRDTMLNPRHGVLASARYEEAFGLDGFGKTNGRVIGMVKKYIPIAKKSSLTLSTRGGVKIHGSDMPEIMAFRLGGPYTVRGYKVNGVGTGTSFIMGSAELATPLPFVDRLKVNFLQNLRLTFWVDAGKVFNPTVASYLYDRPIQAITAGVGLKINIPGVGPLSVDYGIPLTNPGSYGSKNGYFTFGAGDMMY
ncbi:MAG: BamA/TamA family outer membrane protein [bacterium]|nr:BamA/TamA family outer membrane protein [bacterium]